MVEQKRKLGLVVDIFSGAGLGLLLGVIVGMANSPVVAILIGSLTSVLAVFLGLEGGDSKLRAIANIQVNGIRIGSFAFATVFGLFLGLYVRINNPLVESPIEQLERWHTAFPVEVAPPNPAADVQYATDANDARRNRTLARQLMIFERTGLKPATLDYGTIVNERSEANSNGASKGIKNSKSETQTSGMTQVELTGTADSRLAILFGKDNENDPCSELSPDEYTREGKVNLDGWTTAFSVNEFEGVAEMVDAADESDKEQLLIVAHKLLCDISHLAKGEQQ